MKLGRTKDSWDVERSLWLAKLVVLESCMLEALIR